MNRLFASYFVLFSSVIAISGCGESLPGLTGTVTVDGQPAPEGISLQFSPVAGGSPSYATTDASGNYEAEFTFTRKGIEVGEHIVALVPGGSESAGSQMPQIGEDGKPMPQESSGNGGAPSFPRSYYQEIMKITVEPGSNKIDIPLKTGDDEST